MRLLKLELQDFQGIRRFTMDASGENCTVYGTNGSGKTTVANSLSWLLFDKPYTGEKGYSPKTIGEDGQELHHLDHKATATFVKDDGSRITLSRVYHEVWKKKRGSATEEFSGHVTDSYIDGVPVSAKEYRLTLDDLCPPEKAKILTDPRYFAKSLHWEDRRRILLDICGDLKDEEVIGNDPGLTPLWEYLRKPGTSNQFYTVAEFQKIAASRKAELNRELTIIPARIDETLKSIPDTDSLPDEEAIKRQISELEQQKMALMSRAAAMTEDDQVRALRRQLDDIDDRQLQARTAYAKSMEFKHQAANDTIRAMGKAVAAADADYMYLEGKVGRITEQIETMKREREKLLRRHAEVKAKAWEGNTICPACGQPLPEEKVQEAMERFNVQRSRELAEINAMGQTCSKALIEEKEGALAEAKRLMEDAAARKANAAEELKAAQNEVNADPAYEETPEAAALAAERAAVEAQLVESGNTTANTKRAVQAEIEAVTARIYEAQSLRLKYETARDRKARLAELEKQEKDVAAEYERFERGIFLCEEFTRAKIAMLDERINSRFRSVRFRLFRQQINGGLVDACDVMCPTTSGLTPYDSANNAAQVLAGCEIAGVMGRHWGISLPILIDNSEGIVLDIHSDAQIIRFAVSERDKRLRVELDDNTMGQHGAA